jgi:hypothetical protein
MRLPEFSRSPSRKLVGRSRWSESETMAGLIALSVLGQYWYAEASLDVNHSPPPALTRTPFWQPEARFSKPGKPDRLLPPPRRDRCADRKSEALKSPATHRSRAIDPICNASRAKSCSQVPIPLELRSPYARIFISRRELHSYSEHGGASGSSSESTASSSNERSG